MISTLVIVLASAAAVPERSYSPPPPIPQGQSAAKSDEPAKGKLNISKAAYKAIGELQTAVTAKDVANIPAKLLAAQAVAQSTDEKYVISQLQLNAASEASDHAAIEAGLEAMLASGGAPKDQMPVLYLALARTQHKNKHYAKAAESFERLLALTPSNADALILYAETRNSLGQVSESVALMQRAVAVKLASGQKPDETWYKRAVGLAYDAKLPIALELSRKWVAAYPTSANWRDALRLYRQMSNSDEALRLDTLRLARATGALEGDSDFQMFAYDSERSFPGEAKAVIEEGIAAKQIDPDKPLFKGILATLNANKAMGRAALPDLAKDALGTPAARLAVRTGDAYYGYGDYTQAAELYRAALTKDGADADAINLHLGMALARAGDKAGATAALNAVTGPRSELAKYWLLYVATRP